MWRFRVLLQEWEWHFDISYTAILAIKHQFSEKCHIRSWGDIHSWVLSNSEENNQDMTQREMGNVRELSKAEKWLKVNDTGKNTVNQSTEQSQNCWGVPGSVAEPQCAYRQIWAPHFPVWKMKLTRHIRLKMFLLCRTNSAGTIILFILHLRDCLCMTDGHGETSALVTSSTV